MFTQTLPCQTQTAVAPKYVSLQASCACLLYSIKQLFCCMPKTQALSSLRRVEASLIVKLGMSDGHNLLTAIKVQR